MKELYQNTYNKVIMDQTRKQEIRDHLQQTSVKKSRRIPTWAKVSAAAAVILGITLCIPTSRSAVFAAANQLARIFHLENGVTVSYKEKNDGIEESTEYAVQESDTIIADDNPNKSYFEIVDDRIYFVLGNIREDITDQCSNTDYYRYEIKRDDGSRSVILIGGTVNNCGWAELIFDSNGNYVFNLMNVPENDLDTLDHHVEWLDRGMHAEGVPSGNPEYDQE